MPPEPLLEHRIVSFEEMAAWPVDRKRSGEKLWAETTWGGDAPGRPKLFNWNIWPCRVVFEVDQAAEVVRGEAVWRRSSYSIRLRGLKLLSTVAKKGTGTFFEGQDRGATGGPATEKCTCPLFQAQEITDARLVDYDKERVVIDFHPTDGPGLYHLYWGAAEPPLFDPSPQWLERAQKLKEPPRAEALRIEARCQLDSFYLMETIALREEIEGLLAAHPDADYLAFPEDRDRPIKLLFDIPAHWAREGPRREIVLHADRNEYRVFQLGVWACREALPDVEITCSGLKDAAGRFALPADRVQCLTLSSRIKSLYIERPSGRCPVPKGQTRALWFGLDLPDDIGAGEYRGTISVQPPGHVATEIALRLIVSDKVVLDRGDHDLNRLSRLRWIESDIGLSDEVHPPYEPLRVANGDRSISTWGHTLVLAHCGLPEQILFGKEPILAAPISLAGKSGDAALVWRDFDCRLTERTGGHVSWRSGAKPDGIALVVEGRIEYDGCAVLDLYLKPSAANGHAKIDALTLTVPWRKEHASLASGMGYRGRRDSDRLWRKHPRGAQCFSPAIWLGSVRAGLGWVTWETDPWEDVSRPDAATVREIDDRVVLQLNLGSHELSADKPWHMKFALRPTPVKPPDPRHWQFRYIHFGGDFAPGDSDTPQSFLSDGCKRLDELKAMGVKRLNLHDWWGPAFNYAWQWDVPDNLARLTEEAHRRGIYVKVYNSGRELSTLAPEFWALVYEGAQYQFPDALDPEPKGRFQDAWHENHLPDGVPQGWPRLSPGYGNEHAVPVSNHTRNGNFYLESIRYMTQQFGTDGAYWDGADGPTLGHREMAKRLWSIFREIGVRPTNPREPRCDPTRLNVRKGDEPYQEDDMARSPDEADAKSGRNPQGQAIFRPMASSLGLDGSPGGYVSPSAPRPEPESGLSRPRGFVGHTPRPEATIDVHHGDALVTSPITDHMLVFPFIDSLWHGEGFDYDRFDPWTWLVEISGLPFNVPSEVLGGEEFFARGMLFGIWTRAAWCAGTEKQRKLWAFFDRFGIEQATMHGWWEGDNGVTVSRPETVVTAFTHPGSGALLVIASWHTPIAGWMEQTLDVSLLLDRRKLGLPDGELVATDILTDETVDICAPVPLPDPKLGRMLWVRGEE